MESKTYQVFVKLLDGKHRILNFDEPSVTVSALKRRIQNLTSIPSHLQLLLHNSSLILHDHQTLVLAQSRHNSDSELAGDRDLPQLAESPVGFNSNGPGKFPAVVHLLLRLRGGKGGFGSLLRGAGTKAGQKKTNNFDACRDMSGRRLRHVNAEKKLEEWRAEAEERKLEKMAEEFIKKKAKEMVKSGKSNGSDSAEKYVAKYREDSARCMEEVDRSVRESIINGLMSSKRKKGCAEESGSSSKWLKIWMGKRKMGDSDSEDLNEDSSDDEEEAENEKSVVIDTGSHSDSSKEDKASSVSITIGKLDAGSLDGVSSGSGSQEEDVLSGESLKSEKNLDECGLESVVENIDRDEVVAEDEVASTVEIRNSFIPEPVHEESEPLGENLQNLDKPLNFDKYHSAAELEVLGLERLKAELQGWGLKCGGTVQERAARLFLLKTTPLEMLPKKLFAKK